MVDVIPSPMHVMYIKKNSGLRIDPWGTPDVTLHGPGRETAIYDSLLSSYKEGFSPLQ